MEFVGTLPVLMLGAAVCLQALLVAISLLFAQVASDRAARGESRTTALSSMPQAWRGRAQLIKRGDVSIVRIRPPAVIPGVADLLAVEVSSEAAP